MSAVTMGRVTCNPAAQRYQVAKGFTGTLRIAGEPDSTCRNVQL